MRVRRGRWLIAALALAAAGTLPAQSASPLRISRGGAGEIVATAGTVTTIVLKVSNTSTRQLSVLPSISAPQGWAIVLGGEGFPLAPSEAEVAVTSITIPTEAPAGSYVIHIGYAISPETSVTASDSIVVRVLERRAVDLRLVRAPPYVIAGDSYIAEFIARNRGNTIARFAVNANSSLAKGLVVEPAFVTLAPGGTTSLRITVQLKKSVTSTAVDVLVVEAVHSLDSTARASASTGVTVVQPPGYSGPTVMIPATLRLRQPNRRETISRYELVGGGYSSPNGRLDFLARGSTGRNSLFGERDEYRMTLQGPSYNLRAGDNLYTLSPLLAGGQAGFGGGADLNAGVLTAGAYSQRFRFQSGNRLESGASIGLKGSGREPAHISLNALDRPNGPFSGRVGGVDGRLRPISDLDLDFDLARNLTGAHGAARQVHASGQTPFQYDVGYTFGDSLFNGPAQGLTHTYAVLSGNPVGELRLFASGRRFRIRPRGTENQAHDEIYVTTNAGVAWNGALSLNFVNTRQNLGSAILPLDEYERAWSLRTAWSNEVGSIWASAEVGRGHRVNPVGPSRYTAYSSGVTLRFARANFSAFGDVYKGESITRGTTPFVNLGIEASVNITPVTKLLVTSFSSRAVGSATSGYHQIDGWLSHVLGNGSTIMLRGRRTRQGALTQPTIGYLEYSIPFRIPTFRKSVRGGAIGTVIDRDTRAGVPGMLVRLGSHAAITDKSGHVYFGELPPGSYHASIAQEASKAGRIFVGDPDVRIDSQTTRPAKFSLAVERPARVTGTLREWLTFRTGIGGSSDSLVAGEPVAGVSIVMMSSTDTLYRVTDNLGSFDFTELTRGIWILQVVSEPPTMKSFSPPLLMFALEPGETREMELRLVPRRRDIRILNAPIPPPE